MSNSPDRKIGPLTRRQFLIATAGTVVGGVAIGIGINELRRAAATAPAVAASGITPPPDNTPAPAVALATATNAPAAATEAATAVPTVVPTVKPSATEIPPTATAKPDTATATAVPAINTPEVIKAPEKTVLEQYAQEGVWSGTMTGKLGTEYVVFFDLPGVKPTDPHTVLVIIGDGNTRSFGPMIAIPTKTGTNSFKGPDQGSIRIATAQLNEDVISGDVIDGGVHYIGKLDPKGSGLKKLLHECEIARNIATESPANNLISDDQMQSEINKELQRLYKRTLPSK